MAKLTYLLCQPVSFVLEVGIINRLKAAFNVLLLNTGLLHAASAVKFCLIIEIK